MKPEISLAMRFLQTGEEEDRRQLERIGEETAFSLPLQRRVKEIPVQELPSFSREVDSLMKTANRAVLFAVTAGISSERILRQKSREDVVEALYLDALFSAMVEWESTKIQREYEEKAAPLFVSERFSPGYGEIPLTLQQYFYRVLRLSSMGIYPEKGWALLPRKTVTGVFALSETRSPYRPPDCPVCPARKGCDFLTTHRRCNGLWKFSTEPWEAD